MEETTLDLRDLFKIIKRRKWIIIGITVFCLLCGGIVSLIPQNNSIIQEKKELYKSTASVVIEKFPDFNSDSGKSIASLNVNQQVVKTYGAVATSRTVAEKTVKELNLDMKIDEFISNLRVIVNPDAQLITIHYADKTDDEQKDILTAYIDNLINQAKIVYPTGELKILDEPSKSQKISVDDFTKLTSVPAPTQANAQTNIQGTTKNKTLIFAISIILGIMVGFGVAFLVEYIDKSLKKREEAEEILKLPTLTIINNHNKKEIGNEKEAFRILRTNLQLNEDKIFTVTSPSKKDGKTTVSVNLAKAFAEGGFKTLIIDGNGRNPKINEAFNLQKTEGISEMLDIENNLMINEITSKILNTGDRNPDILSWGNVNINPADLLSRSNVAELLRELKDKFDYIVIDTASMVNYCDAQIFSKVSDGTIIVAKEGKTNKDEVVRMKEIIDIAGIDARGMVWIEGNY